MIARISKRDKSVRGTIQLPPSKSIYNRVQIIRALCKGSFRIFPEATPRDSMLLQNLLKSDSTTFDAEDAGTTFRFLTAYLAQKPGEWFLTGNTRMRERPIGLLVDALRKLEADINYTEKEGFPPLRIKGRKLKGTSIKIDGNISSQFISALLMIAPVLEGGLELTIEGEIQSRSYIEMTLKMMTELGIKYEWKENVIRIKEHEYASKDYTVEADWSSASYWYEIAALAEEVDILLLGLNKNSLQGDSIISELMKTFGVESEFTNDGVLLRKNSASKLSQKFVYNFQSCPDLVQTMVVACSALNIETEFEGIQSLRIKETDRLMALKNELEKVGTEINISTSTLKSKTPNLKPKTLNPYFKTYIDHRMALSLAPLALKFGEVEIENPDVIGKSYPNFWQDLEKVGFDVKFIKTEI